MSALIKRIFGSSSSVDITPKVEYNSEPIEKAFPRIRNEIIASVLEEMKEDIGKSLYHPFGDYKIVWAVPCKTGHFCIKNSYTGFTDWKRIKWRLLGKTPKSSKIDQKIFLYFQQYLICEVSKYDHRVIDRSIEFDITLYSIENTVDKMARMRHRNPFFLNTLQTYAKIAAQYFAKDKTIMQYGDAIFDNTKLWEGPGIQYASGIRAAYLNRYFTLNIIECCLQNPKIDFNTDFTDKPMDLRRSGFYLGLHEIRHWLKYILSTQKETEKHLPVKFEDDDGCEITGYINPGQVTCSYGGHTTAQDIFVGAQVVGCATHPGTKGVGLYKLADNDQQTLIEYFARVFESHLPKQDFWPIFEAKKQYLSESEVKDMFTNLYRTLAFTVTQEIIRCDEMQVTSGMLKVAPGTPL